MSGFKPLTEKDKHVPKECSICKVDNYTRVFFEKDVLSALAGLKEEMQDNGITIHYVDKWFQLKEVVP